MLSERLRAFSGWAGKNSRAWLATARWWRSIVYAFTYAVYVPAKGAQMEVRNASVAVVDEDRSALSGRIVDALLAPFFCRQSPLRLDEIDAAMDAGRFTFVIDIPPRFQADLEAGRRPSIQLNVDATAMSQAGRGAGYIQSIIVQEVQRFRPNASSAPQDPVRCDHAAQNSTRT